MELSSHNAARPFNSADELDLFSRGKAGDKGAILVLFQCRAKCFRRTVCRHVARRLCSILDPDDFLQDIALVLLTKPMPDWITTPSDFTRYVRGIAKNVVLAQNRKHLDGKHHSLHHEVNLASISVPSTPLSAQATPHESVQEKESLRELLDWLPLRVRDIVTWVCAGYSVAEVAAAFGIDQETVVDFVCAARNYAPHGDHRIDRNEAMRFFKRCRSPRQPTLAQPREMPPHTPRRTSHTRRFRRLCQLPTSE